jgi:hypothetical protein
MFTCDNITDTVYNRQAKHANRFMLLALHGKRSKQFLPYYLPTRPFAFLLAPLGSTKVKLINRSLIEGAASLLKNTLLTVEARTARTPLLADTALRAKRRNITLFILVSAKLNGK